MRDLEPATWALLAGAVIIVLILLIRAAGRRGREDQEHEQTIRRSQTMRVILAVLLLTLIVGFAVANTHAVTIEWLFATTVAPMVLVIAVSGGVGFLLGALVAYRSRVE